jgi:MFS family permease
MCGSVGPAALLVAFAATISPELIARSREVSEIPLYALFVIAAAASLVAALRAPRGGRLVALAVSHALALFTYYLAPFLVAANGAILAWRQPPRRVVAAFAAGIALGAPAIGLGAATLLRDWSARDVARAFPGLAWGEHSPLSMAKLMVRIAGDTFGPPLFALLLVAVAVGFLRRRLAVIAPALAALATFAGIALLSPIARVQGYYVITVLPAAALALAALPLPAERRARAAWLAALAGAIVFSTVPRLAAARSLYNPDAAAFMPRFAAAIAARAERTVVTVAHYDQALLGYYLARLEGRRIAWYNLNAPHRQRVLPLVLAHSLHAGAEEEAVRRLDELAAAAPILVVENDSFLLPRVVARLARCEELLRAPNARLLRCAPDAPPLPQ